MNERIKELEMQVAHSFDPLKYYSAQEYSLEFNRRFAELIVRECIKICSDIESDEELCGLSDGALVCMAEIKQYFGVKE